MATATTKKAETGSSNNGRGGRGRVLTEALQEVDSFPALVPARDRIVELGTRGADTPELAEVAESDVGLTITVLRAASLVTKNAHFKQISDAIDALGPERTQKAVQAAPTYVAFEPARGGMPDPERFRLHALGVQRATDAIAIAIGSPDRDQLAIASLLHDAGRLVLARLHAGYSERFDRRLGTPEERINAERKELGIDHALVGGVLARRWGLDGVVATAIERHHAEQAEGSAAILRSADMIAAHLAGTPVSAEKLFEVVARVDLDEDALRGLVYELPRGGSARKRATAPCPLSARELEVLRGLAEGKVYKQIAAELDLSASTVRSHLHNVYGKLGALDRAQAVLMATERGWL